MSNIRRMSDTQQEKHGHGNIEEGSWSFIWKPSGKQTVWSCLSRGFKEFIENLIRPRLPRPRYRSSARYFMYLPCASFMMPTYQIWEIMGLSANSVTQSPEIHGSWWLFWKMILSSFWGSCWVMACEISRLLWARILMTLLEDDPIAEAKALIIPEYCQPETWLRYEPWETLSWMDPSICHWRILKTLCIFIVTDLRELNGPAQKKSRVPWSDDALNHVCAAPQSHYSRPHMILYTVV